MIEQHKERSALVDERRGLVERKLLLETKIATITESTKERRDMISEVHWINKNLAAINKGLSSLHREILNAPKPEKKQRSFTWEILEEILPPEQMDKIKHENYRRKNGEPPMKLQLFEVVENTEKADKYRLLAGELLNELIAARQRLNAAIEAGCAKWDKGEFLKAMSPINTAIKPVGEYEKLKRLNNLK